MVFWHIANSDAILLDQLEQIRDSKFGGKVKYVVDSCPDRNSEHALSSLKNTPGFVQVKRAEQFKCGVEYYEMPTLWALHEHCRSQPNDFVAYVHTKSDRGKRRAYMDQILGSGACVDQCLSKGKVACGIRLHEPLDGPCPRLDQGEAGVNEAPWCHFSGNFWWARCDHVQTLNPPWSDSLLEEFKVGEDHKGWWGDVRPYGRFFAEWWVLNDVKKEYRTDPGSVIYGYSKDGEGLYRQAHIVKPFSCPSWNNDWRLEDLVGKNVATEFARTKMREICELLNCGGTDTMPRWKAICPASQGYSHVTERVCDAAALASE